MKSTCIVFLLSIIASNSILAEGLRCGTKVVEVGDHKSRVLNVCGQPRTQDIRNKCESMQLKNGAYRQICGEIEEWTYKTAQGKFLTLVEIRDNRVSNISYADR